MKRKGFTLVELLAVIVILAVIAIITIPIIGNVIEDSRKKALETSVYGLVAAANYYAIYNDEAHVVFGENATQNQKEILDYSGEIEAEGDLYIDKDGNISLCLMNESYYVYKNYNSGIVIGNRSEDSCKARYDELTNKYIAYLESEGEGSNVYDKEYINNLEDNLQSQIAQNADGVEELQNNLSNYALQSTLEDTKNMVETLSTSLNATDTKLQSNIDLINNNLEPKLLTPTINTTDWITNESWAERSGNVVILHVYIKGIPINFTPIMSNLPKPLGRVDVYNGSGSPSILRLESDGILKLQSAGVLDTQLIACDISYITND